MKIHSEFQDENSENCSKFVQKFRQEMQMKNSFTDEDQMVTYKTQNFKN